MRYNILSYLIGEGIKNVFKNKKSTSASLIIMCLTMIIFGIFYIISSNINSIVTQVEAAQGIQVFFKLETTDEAMKDYGEKIKAIDGVSTAVFKTKEDALNQMKEKFKDKSYLLTGLDGVLPASYVVTLTDLSLSNQVQDEITKLLGEDLKNITSRDDTITTLLNLANGIKIVTGVILVFLILISIFIIANTIKLTVHARRKEISIMKYVGATNSFIRWPFIVEGILIGILAGAMSILIIGLAYSFIAEKIVASAVIASMNIGLLTFADMFSSIIIVYLLLGAGIGIIGSSISMNKYLKV